MYDADNAQPKTVPYLLTVEEEETYYKRVRSLFAHDVLDVARETRLNRVLNRIDKNEVDVVLVTGNLLLSGGAAASELLDSMARGHNGPQLLLLATPVELETLLTDMKAGTYQYGKLPLDNFELKALVESALQQITFRADSLRSEDADSSPRSQTILGRSRRMREVYRQIQQAAETDIPILILGETGTGKDLAAQAIHENSPRRNGPYLPVHLGAFPQELVASELFGHEKGAFTGAHERRIGKFEQADQGTIFLDEIGTIDERIQISLLRLIEQKIFNRLGGRETLHSNVRVVAATNENLNELVITGSFREDLLYRLDVFRVTMPPLRERQSDIPVLVRSFLRRFNRSIGKQIKGVESDCMTLLQTYPWPGNVRELKNVIQRAVLICEGDTLVPANLPQRFTIEIQQAHKITFEIGTPLREVEREMIIRVLSVSKNRTQAAALLGISRRALYNKIERYGIT